MKTPTDQFDLFNSRESNQTEIDSFVNLPEETPATEEYEALDYQLAELMVELNDFVPDAEAEQKALNKTLRHCTLEISKRTREGQIAKEITPKQQLLLLQTTVVGEAGEYMPLIIDTEVDTGVETAYLYLNRYWQYQQRLADQINQRIQSQDTLSDAQQAWAQTRLLDYFPADDQEINWQKQAAEHALENKFLIVSGGPGTGKTTTITRILALLIEQRIEASDIATTASANNTDIIELNVSKDETASSLKSGGVSFNILLAAPTGKAAIRMIDSMREASNALRSVLELDDAVLDHLPKQANTIHKLLAYKHNSTQFKHNKNNPLNADVVLVDEASMVDIALMSKLIEAVPEHAKLILIGDKDQLASVETGSVFADMCQGLEDRNLKNSDNLVTLKKNWRFDANSDIGQCAIAANQGDTNTLLSVLNDPSRSDVELIAPKDMRDADLIKPWKHYLAVVSNPESSLTKIFSAFNQYRVLCALRRGFNGSETINNRLETALDKQGFIQRRRGGSLQGMQKQSNWYQGRPIMITQNSYNRGLFNGDTGITLIRDGEIKVYFPTTDSSLSVEGSHPAEGFLSAEGSDGEFKAFSPIRLPAHETTWAMTIHKSQGSEFNQVVLILPQEEMPLLTRQLVYTGITRAKESVSIVASESVLVTGVRAEVVRATRIEQQLKNG